MGIYKGYKSVLNDFELCLEFNNDEKIIKM